MSDHELPTCPIHQIVMEDIRELRGHAEETAKQIADLPTIRTDIIDLKDLNKTLVKTINDGIQRILWWMVILFGSAAVGLVLYIFLEHVGKP